MPVLVTNCTARKRVTETVLSMSSEMIGSSFASTVSNWRRALASHQTLRAAKDVYVGRSIIEAQYAAKSAKGALYFVSAGLGIVAANDLIPTYDLTPAKAKAGLSVVLKEHKKSSSDWWDKLSINGLSKLINQFSSEQFLIALPATYLRMVANDLSLCDVGDTSRLRIFTSSAGVRELPELLAKCVMPYDERLESIPGFAGTRSDFPQRAMKHFVEELDAVKIDTDCAHSVVENALAAYRPRKILNRKRLDDMEIKQLIITKWDSCQGRSARLLRAIRDEEMVACEQGRFAHLWREVRNLIVRTNSEEVAP